MSEPTSEVGQSQAILLVPAEGITEVELDGQVCLYSPLGEQVLVLNETASDVWRLADGTLDVAGVVGILARTYQADPEQIHTEVLDVVNRLRAAGALTTTPAP